MLKTIPSGAALLLDFISTFESGGSYTIVFGNHATSQPITSMSVNDLLAAQKVWGRKWGSSAAGRYQIMQTTLTGLVGALKLTGKEIFTPDLQDALAYQLLKQRGYARFKSGALSREAFGRNLAQEWASLPVLAATQGAHRKVARSETFYAGDRLNRALISPDKVEAILANVAAAAA